MKLTQRDRIMLTVVVIVLMIFLGVWFIIRPAWKEVQNSKKELNEVRSTYQEKQDELEKKEHVKDQVTEIYNESVELSKPFYEGQQGYVISEEVYNYFVDAGLNVTSNTFSLNSKQLQKYQYNPSGGVNIPMDEYANINDTNTGADDANANAAAASQTVGCYSFNLEFDGAKREQLFELIDKLKTLDHKTLVVTNVSFDVAEAEGVAEEDDNEEGWQGSVSMELYYLNPPEEPNFDAPPAAAEDTAAEAAE